MPSFNSFSSIANSVRLSRLVNRSTNNLSKTILYNKRSSYLSSFNGNLNQNGFIQRLYSTSTKEIKSTVSSAVNAIPNKPKKKGFFRRHYGKMFFVLFATAGALISFDLYLARHPPQQLPHDPTKKTIAILGSGWAATSILKDIDTEFYNVVVVSPRNYFLFTPLLPSCTVGTIELRSIMMPIRYITRFKKREVKFIEGECTEIDYKNKVIEFEDNSEIKGAVSKQTQKYDYLIVACGAENATFGIPGVKEYSCFLKEAWDARKIRTRLMDCLETAAFKDQTPEEIERLLHMVVVGGGPTGVEYAAELHDYLKEDLADWYPELVSKIKITLVEALPHVLPMFSKSLIEYTEKHFAEAKVNILSRTMVKEVRPTEIIIQNAEKKIDSIPYGILVWAAGNTARPVIKKLLEALPSDLQNQRRGLVVDDYLKVKGADGIYALGDASCTKYAPTAQVASRQGFYLAQQLNKLGKIDNDKELLTDRGVDIKALKEESLIPFEHKTLGALAYIGDDKAIADLPGNVSVGGCLAFYVWRSAYLSNLFSIRNRILVAYDWSKKTVFGRDISRE